MTKAYFVTGTDTEVGKTYTSCKILEAFSQRGKTALGYKPVAVGCDWQNNQWENEDALALQAAGSLRVPLTEINPIALPDAIAPHIAAERHGEPISEAVITSGFQALQQYQPDILLMEGAGGWRLPLSSARFLSDVVKDLQLDVILVVGMRLGCLNHALLTAEAIQRDGLTLKGWVANQLSDDMPVFDENLATLDALMPAPRLALVPYQQTPDLSLLVEKLG